MDVLCYGGRENGLTKSKQKQLTNKTYVDLLRKASMFSDELMKTSNMHDDMLTKLSYFALYTQYRRLHEETMVVHVLIKKTW